MTVLAVDLGGSHATCALVAGTAILKQESFRLAPGASFGAVLPKIEVVLRRLLEQVPSGVDCRGIGFGFCGLVDPIQSRIVSTNGKYDDACDIDLNVWAHDRFGLALRLENDARLALLGECLAGAGAGSGDAVMMTLGTGVGGAAMIGGKLLHGKHFQAGCLGGHFVVNWRGRACTCGNRGCIEAEASGWSLPLLCREHPLFPSSALAAFSEINFEDLFRLAAQGDACAINIREECVEVWAAGCVTMIHAYDPDVLIVGGGVMKSADQVLPRLQAHVERYAWTPWGKVRVRAAELSDAAPLIGAVSLFERDSR